MRPSPRRRRRLPSGLPQAWRRSDSQASIKTPGGLLGALVNLSLESCTASYVAGRYADVFKPRRLRERFLPGPGRTAWRNVPCQREWLAQARRQRDLRRPGDAGAVLLPPQPFALAGDRDRGKLQRARADPAWWPRRFHALRAVARTRRARRAVLVLRQPQADHAFDQAALDLLADRG